MRYEKRRGLGPSRLAFARGIIWQENVAAAVERLGLELVGDRAGLVLHVAGVVTQAGYLNLRDHDFLDVAPHTR